MFRLLCSTLIIIDALIVPARAEDVGFTTLNSMLYPAQAAFLLFAMGIAAYFAYTAFNSPAIKLGDGPTLPRYMTQPRQYRMAMIAYVIMCLVFYDLGTYFFKDLLPLADFIAPAPLETLIHGAITNGALSFPLTVVFAAMLFVVLLRTEADWNPLFLLRRLVWGWVSIPQLANTIMLLARDALIVPIGVRAEVAGCPDTPNVDAGDFDKDRNSLDRHWAELCYIRLWLAKNRAEGTHYTFFNEPSFSWDKLEADYERARRNIAPLKHALIHGDPPDLAEVAAAVESLRARYCRLAACFIVFKNETKKKVIWNAKEFGVPMDDRNSRSNPLRYLSIFLVAIVIAIYVGVSLSAMIWDLLHGDLSSGLRQDPNVFTRWTGYAMFDYGMPILAVLLLCYFGWTVNHEQPYSYPMSYARIFVTALCVSAVSLAFAIKFLSRNPLSLQPFVDIVLSEFKWSLSPALISVYIAYHVDRQIDPLLPDIASSVTYSQMVQRIIMCISFGLIVTWLSLQPSLSLSPSSPSAWPVEKLRAVVIGTTFTIGLIVALVGEFFLIKPKQAAKPGD